MSRLREQARKQLSHYLMVALTRIPDPDDTDLDPDTATGIDEIADLIIEAAVEEAVSEVASRFAVNKRRPTSAVDRIKAAEDAANGVD